MRVLVVTSDMQLEMALMSGLQRADFDVVTERDYETAEALVAAYRYDATIVDLDVPNAVDWVCKLRKRWTLIGVVGPGEAAYRRGVPGFWLMISALLAGADDVLMKPFHLDELAARIGACVRRWRGYPGSVVRVGDLEVHLDAGQALVRGRPVPLTKQEYRVLEVLVLRLGGVVDQEAFLDAVYGGVNEPDARIFDVFICKIRKKLAAAGAPDVVQTVWGRGYTIDPDPDKDDSRSQGEAA